ncbi:hypothetical protein CVV68_20990 [Arthrobacter livingstonensis]|uniref:D-isomer specific 2-hydroxyacid dehydrogenase NAD-binding domain-containing protein n=1 Tax=Arthrobacter livingstonensis TaxID=670078 RepID=A0A2V5L4W3_9MICC|nr:NAD(P)-dependent oxidoreductase [Arthrobacter livingstonensis]PYI64743.1 hypothetical protein CVV68_20990 [Arthrobacter livingstonensis]
MATFEQSLQEQRVTVVVGVPVDSQVVGAIKNVDGRIDVLCHDPSLEPAARQRALAQAEIVFGIPGDTPAGLTELLRSNAALRWVHATNQGALERLRSANTTGEGHGRIQFTGPGGSHAGALAEFAMFGLLAFAKQLPERHTARQDAGHPMSELAGQTLLILGLGSVGAEVARLGKAFGMRVLAMTRTGNGHAPNVDELRPARFLGDMLPVSHAVVLALPLTEQTAGLVGTRAISKIRSDAVLVNVGHGGVLDSQALVKGLEQGQPTAVVLDAFSAAQLPDYSVLRSMPNVLISPHTAADTRQENARNTELFIANLRRYLRGEELVGRL